MSFSHKKGLRLSGALIILFVIIDTSWPALILREPIIPSRFVFTNIVPLLLSLYCLLFSEKKSVCVTVVGSCSVISFFMAAMRLYEYPTTIQDLFASFQVHALFWTWIIWGMIYLMLVVLKFKRNAAICVLGTVLFAVVLAQVLRTCSFFFVYQDVRDLMNIISNILFDIAIFNIWYLEGGVSFLKKPLLMGKERELSEAQVRNDSLENNLVLLKHRYESKEITEEEYNRKRKDLIEGF